MGVGVCQGEAPALFAVNDDGFVEVLRHPADATELEAAARAVRLCPSQALRLVTAGDTEIEG
jgi:ferredoxin